jgi:hypothetical protein
MRKRASTLRRPFVSRTQPRGAAIQEERKYFEQNDQRPATCHEHEYVLK